MKVFIANFPFDFSEEDICELFTIFGEIVACKLVTDPGTGKSKGYGFIEFRGRRQARLAMKNMHSVEIGGRFVAVTPSTSESAKAGHSKQSRLKDMS